MTQSGLLCPREIYGLAKYRVDHPARGIALCREVIAVAVAQIDRNPVVCYRLVDPALEIAVAHVIKIITLKHAARRYPVAYKNAENLAADLIIGRSVEHVARLRSRHSITLGNSALAVREPSAFSIVIPLSVERSHGCLCLTAVERPTNDEGDLPVGTIYETLGAQDGG